MTEEIFVEPRLGDGSLITLETQHYNATALVAVHRALSTRKNRPQQRLSIDVATKRLPQSEEPRHYYLSVWAANGVSEAPQQLTDERLMDIAAQPTTARVASFSTGLLASELHEKRVWLVVRAYRVGRLRDTDAASSEARAQFIKHDPSLAGFDACENDVPLFRRPVGVAVIDLSAALAKEDLVLRPSSRENKSQPHQWWTVAAPCFRPSATEAQVRSRIFARLPYLLPLLAVTQSNDEVTAASPAENRRKLVRTRSLGGSLDDDDSMPPPPPPAEAICSTPSSSGPDLFRNNKKAVEELTPNSKASPESKDSPGLERLAQSIESAGTGLEVSIAARLDPPAPGPLDALPIQKSSIYHAAALQHCGSTRAQQLRDELYITLESASFSQDGKVAPRSVEVRARLLHSDTGREVPGLSRGWAPTSTLKKNSAVYRSSTHYHANRPTWEETFRVDLPSHIQELEKYHLHLQFAHCRNEARRTPRSIFAFTFLPLSLVEAARHTVEGVSLEAVARRAVKTLSPHRDRARPLISMLPIPDGEHRLTCYKPEAIPKGMLKKTTSNEDELYFYDDEDDAMLATKRSSFLENGPAAVSVETTPAALQHDKKEAVTPSYLKGSAQARGRRVSAAGALQALGGAFRGGLPEEKFRLSEKEWFVVRTRLVSEKRAPAEAPELHAILRWQELEPGVRTVTALKELSVFSPEYWPARFYFSCVLKALLEIFMAKRAADESEEAFAAIVSTLRKISCAGAGSRPALRSALVSEMDTLLPRIRDAENMAQWRQKVLAKKKASESASTTNKEDSTTETLAESDTWVPSFGGPARPLAPQRELDETPSKAEESWNLFLAQSAALERERQLATDDGTPFEDDDDDDEDYSHTPDMPTAPSSPPEPKPPDPATNGIKKSITVHAALLKALTLALKEDEDASGALDSVITLACANFARAGGVFIEERQSQGEPSTLELLDELFHQVAEILTSSAALGNNSRLVTLCVASLPGTFEALHACFPLHVVAERYSRLVQLLCGESMIEQAAELGLLRVLARAPILRASTDDIARRTLVEAVAHRAATLLANTTNDFIQGLAAQVLGEVVAAAQAARDIDTARSVVSQHLATCLEAATAAAKKRYQTEYTNAKLKKLAAAYSDDEEKRNELAGLSDDASIPKKTSVRRGLGKQRSLRPKLQRRSRSREDVTRRSSTALKSVNNTKVVTADMRPRYWQSSFDVLHTESVESENAREDVARDALLDLTATCLSLVELQDEVVAPDTVLHCFRWLAAASPIDASRWPLLAAKSWLAYLAAMDRVGDARKDSNFFELGLILLEAPETDLEAISDARLDYLFSIGGEPLADIRASILLRLHKAWAELTADARLALCAPVLPRAARLLAASSRAVAKLAATLLSDLAVAEHTVLGRLLFFERRLLEVVDDAFRDEEIRCTRGRAVTAALEKVLPKALTESSLEDSAWQPALSRMAELRIELATLARPDAGELERAAASGRVVADNGPLLRPDEMGEKPTTWARRAARRLTELAALMADTGGQVEAGLCLLRAAAHYSASFAEEEEEQQKDDQIEDTFVLEIENHIAQVPVSTHDTMPSSHLLDAALESTFGIAAARCAKLRRAAGYHFAKAAPPAWELAIACTEKTIYELRRCDSKDTREEHAATRHSLRLALASELRLAAHYYAALDQEPKRRACAIFRCRFDQSAHIPLRLRGREFVYRGEANDQLVDFVARLRADVHADLELLGSAADMAPLTQKKASSDDECTLLLNERPQVQASLLSAPEPEEADQVNAFLAALLPEIQQAATWPSLLDQAFGLAEANAPWQPRRIWAHEWPVPRPTSSDSALELWVDRRFVVLDEPLAAVARWIPIVASKTIRLNPMELAIRQLRHKNIELTRILAELDKVPPAGALQRHSMAINGVVDAAVNGGLKNWAPFLTGQFVLTHPDIQQDLDSHPDIKGTVPADFENAIRDHLNLVSHCVSKHTLKCPPSMQPLAEHIEQESWPRLRAELTTLLDQALARRAPQDLSE